MMIMLCINRDDFASSILILKPFISFSCLITLAGISCSTLSKSDKNGNI